MAIITVAEIGEYKLIERIHSRVPPPPASIVVGIGDDAAVIEPDRGMLTVVTTDAIVEGVHFERALTPPDAIGFKALAVSLSDLAAMGATPRHALLSIALPGELPIADLDALLQGLLDLAGRYGTTIVGGNITRSNGPLFFDVTAFGSVKRRCVLKRSGARPGDDVYVSGLIGSAAAGLSWLQGSKRDGTEADVQLVSCLERYLRPEPRVRLGTLLGRNRATRACIDLSDGLAEGLRQLTRASDVGVMIDAERIPVDPGARVWFELAGLDPFAAALVGGEDYELLFTVPKSARGRFRGVQRLGKDPSLTRIGIITEERDLLLRLNGKNEPLPKGYEHFR